MIWYSVFRFDTENTSESSLDTVDSKDHCRFSDFTIRDWRVSSACFDLQTLTLAKSLGLPRKGLCMCDFLMVLCMFLCCDFTLIQLYHIETSTLEDFMCIGLYKCWLLSVSQLLLFFFSRNILHDALYDLMKSFFFFSFKVWQHKFVIQLEQRRWYCHRVGYGKYRYSFASDRLASSMLIDRMVRIIGEPNL